MYVRSLRTWGLSVAILGATLCLFPANSKADSYAIDFTCDTCTITAPTGTISATGDLMVTWGTLGTFDLGDVASDLGFTSPSFLTNGYTAEWTADSNYVFFNLNNEAGTFGVEYVNGINFGSLPTDQEGNPDNFGTYTVSVTATPLPAALPLFAGGLGLLGLFGRRRKQKAEAAAIAA
jgi:hypothetical protein